MLVLEGLVGLHRTVQHQLLQHGQAVFGGFQCLPVSGVQKLVAILVLLQEEMSTCPSIPPE